jgi:hypothetical protein
VAGSHRDTDLRIGSAEGRFHSISVAVDQLLSF